MTSDAIKSIDGQSAKPARRWFRFSLRSLLLLVAVLAIPLGWLGWKVNRARNQRIVVTELQKLNAQFIYDYQIVIKNGWLTKSNLSSPGPKWLTELLGNEFFTDVYCVTVDDPKATNETIALIAKLPGVEGVNLTSRTGITDVGLVHFAEMHNVDGVKLVSDRITGSGLVHLTSLKRLKRLWASRWITDDALEHISKLERLELLHLFEAVQISDRGLAHIAKLRNLRELIIGSGDSDESGVQDCMNVSDEGLANLYALTNLEYLSLNTTEVTQVRRDNLRKALPNCRIEWNLSGPYNSDVAEE